MWFYILLFTTIYWNYKEIITIFEFLDYMWKKDTRPEDNLEEKIKKFSNNIFNIFCNIIRIKLQAKEKNVYKISSGKICVEYEFCGSKYKLNSKFKKGPNKKQIQIIENENNENIYDKIEPYLGPNEDFHQINYTCNDFDEKYLKFIKVNNEFQEFRDDEIIKL